MKKGFILAALIFTELIGSCKKGDTGTTTGSSYRGTVIKNICCQIVIQTVGTNNLGQSWTDGATRYDHVFKVSNACQFGDHIAGDTINFKVVGAEVQNCACCMVYTTTPDTSYAIQVVN